MYKFSVFFFLLVSTIACNSQKEKEAEEVITSGNPIFEGWYADPEVIIFDDEYWIYPTYSAKFDDQVFMDAFSSKDLVNWEKHERIIDTAAVSWARRAMWAPSIIEKDGKYFLFFGANDIQTPESPWWRPERAEENQYGGIGIGVSDNPGGPFKDYLGKPLIKDVHNLAQPIDQFVFKEGNDYYIVYGGWSHCNIGKLKPDFTGLIPFENGELFKEITPEGYVEGPIMFKRKGKTYFMWSEGGWGNGTYKVAYGIGDSIFGPFEKKETILQSDPDVATGAGHHSVFCIPGTDEWYIVYHRRPIPNEDRDHRVTCIDRMYFNEDGTIKPIKMTFEGVKARKLKE